MDLLNPMNNLKIITNNKLSPLDTGHKLVGALRINPKFYTDAYITSNDGGTDILIEGISSRKAALEGDIVCVTILDRQKWKVDINIVSNHWFEWSEHLTPICKELDSESVKLAKNIPSHLPKELSQITYNHIKQLPFASSCMRRTGKVVKILEKRHNRLAGGYISKYDDLYALFTPTDHRLPRILLQLNECPPDFMTAPARYKDILFVCHIGEDWRPGQLAIGTLLKNVGRSNTAESVMETVLLENQITDTDFHEDVYKSLEYLDKLPKNWIEKEVRKRSDLRNMCVFTIDPKTARDLDDAVSIREICDGQYEVGVHIADVSYFVNELSPVDYYARLRTTSVYLVDRVIPMLPRVLCENMCSLNPDETKLTFSVIWKLDENGIILDEWFGRTAIKSCVKLSYEQAQDFIDNPNDISWIREGENVPYLKEYSWKYISKSIYLLNSLASRIRKRRFEGGALKIDQIKLKFELDPETGHPIGFQPEERKDANFLIEEFMLLANMSVAKKIYKSFPEFCLLRRHPQAEPNKLKELKEFCDVLGCPFDPSSAGTIQKSLNLIKDPSLFRVVSFLLLKGMKNAEYICTGTLGTDIDSYRHFALNVPFYTHFTSPIRRYSDVLVHRLLALALGYSKDSKEDVQTLTAMAADCTQKKLAAKLVSDTSQKLYFSLFVEKAGFCELKACVTKVLDRSFDVVLIDYDRVSRVYTEPLKPYLKGMTYENRTGLGQIDFEWLDKDDFSTNKQLCHVSQSSDGEEKTPKQPKKALRRLKKKLAKFDNDDTKSRDCLEAIRIDGLGFQVKDFDSTGKTIKQRIRALDIIKVYAVVDKKDICKLKVYLKTPHEQFNQDLLIKIR